MREQRISGTAGPFSSLERLPQPFGLPYRAAAMLAERGGKQQCQQLSQKGSVDKEQARSVHESERSRTAPNGTNRQPRSASPRPAAPSVHPSTLRHTRRRRRTPLATAWPQQATPPPHAAARARPRSRCSDSCRAPPKLALYPLSALVPRCTHHDRPCNQASGGEQPSLPPPGRGAAAPSSPPSPVISRLICAPQ